MAHTREILIQSFAAKIGRPPRRQPRKIEGGFMKVKSSRGIVMKLICCMALVVLTSVVAFSQTPKSGALLEITGNVTDGVNTTAVNLKVYDSQIHTGFVGVPELPGTSPASNCGSGDEIP